MTITREPRGAARSSEREGADREERDEARSLLLAAADRCLRSAGPDALGSELLREARRAVRRRLGLRHGSDGLRLLRQVLHLKRHGLQLQDGRPTAR
jgi:hypothetical protein